MINFLGEFEKEENEADMISKEIYLQNPIEGTI